VTSTQRDMKGARKGKLCGSLVSSRLADRGVTLGLIGCSVAAEPERAWRVALIVAELVVNSLRHAFTEHCGRIIVGIDRRGDTIECEVADDGRATGAATPAYGSAIAEALARELGGHIEREFGSRGRGAFFPFRSNPRDRMEKYVVIRARFVVQIPLA
jgi:two-component sensor histidine kinase